MRINTNIPALYAYNALSQTNDRLGKSIARLSTGLRINSAADDAAGLAISEKMRAQYRGLEQASRNAQDGISMIQTAEGALNETHSILQRMRELSVQAANDTLTQEDRSYIQLEIDQLKEEITRISKTTQFNKKQLLDGSAAAVWSSDNLNTKAIINGGLREIDQFGQKAAVEGNFKISITADPGQAQIQKSDIFKIKHPNVLMNVSTNKAAGFESIRMDGLPAGAYAISVRSGSTTVSASFNKAQYLTNTTASIASLMTLDYANLTNAATANLNLLFEVVDTNTGAGTVTFSVLVVGIDREGNTLSYRDDAYVMGTASFKGGGNSIGFNFWTSNTFNLAGASASVLLTKGDKFVMNVIANAGTVIELNGTIDTSWDGAWVDGMSAATVSAAWNVEHPSVQGEEVQFKSFYLNPTNGEVHEGNVIIAFNENLKNGAAASGGSFEVAYIGQAAKGDVQLRDLDKFWDANGKFMLDDPKTITMVQGDGKKTSITLYSTDTLDDVAKKMNDAIAFGLGQGKYAMDSINNFVTFVDEETAKANPNTPQSVAGTFVINSLIAGKNGTISFSGDEDIIKAFSLNVIQQETENAFSVSVADAHSGNMVASGVRVTGNMLKGVIHENVDVLFDAMANIEVTWSDAAARFMLKRSNEVYSTILHLADNTTVFQIGANEGEDMGINIGDMSAESLGIAGIIVTDRESAARSITIVDNAINKVSLQRAKLGAYQNRLEHTINNLTIASTNMQASESRIRDADMAKEMMEFTKLNILSQAGNSMLAQANQLPQNVLSLLR